MIELIKLLLAQRSSRYYVLITLIVALPLLALVALGYYTLWAKGWLLWFSLGLLGFAFIGVLLRYCLINSDGQDKQQGQRLAEQTGDLKHLAHLSSVADWSDKDVDVWQQSLENIERLQLAETAWSDLYDAVLEQVAFVAASYHQGSSHFKYAFTLPEVLLMLEKCSREYRGHVLEKFPLSQSIKVSTVMGVSTASTKVYSTYKKYSLLLDTLTAVFTAGASVPKQVATKIGAEFGKDLSVHMQQNLKQLLFEQVSQVAIDLYSGRLKLSDAELSVYRASLTDEPQAIVRPLSVMVLGQINAGKSSLVNALLEKSVAEVDVISATAGFHHYQLSLTDSVDIVLKDSPGIDGSKATTKALLKEAAKADLLLWLSQANQPAKSLDKQLMDEWNQYFETHLKRKKPPVLLVTTHNDLLKPQQSWQPPYDLNNSENSKAQAMVAAARYTRQSLGLSEDCAVVPVALKPKQPAYNIDVLRDILIDLSAEARATQLNRERLDGADQKAALPAILSQALSQTTGLAGEGIKLIFR